MNINIMSGGREEAEDPVRLVTVGKLFKNSKLKTLKAETGDWVESTDSYESRACSLGTH